jgi:hypothetical protein
MKPKVEGTGFTADFSVQERKNMKAVHALATLCAKLEIKGAKATVVGIQDMLGSCGYEGDLEESTTEDKSEGLPI